MMMTRRRITKRLRREIGAFAGERTMGFRRDECDSLRAGVRRARARVRNDATCRGRDVRGDDEARTTGIHSNRG